MQLRCIFALTALGLLLPVWSTEHECSICEPNTYCYVERKYQCHAHSSSPAGSDAISDCVCHAGYYLDPDEPLCIECEENYYCPGGQTQLRIHCPPNTQADKGATSEEMCVCTPGHTLDGANCVPCAAGAIKVSVGNAQCTPCSQNYYSLSTLACAACPALTQSAVGSARVEACVSAPGAFLQAYGQPQTASLCPPASYQDTANQTACKACPANTYQINHGAAQAAACLGCPAHSAIWFRNESTAQACVSDTTWTDTAGDGCDWYAENLEYCGHEESSEKCCVCGGGVEHYAQWVIGGPGVALSNCTCDLGYTGPDGGPCAPCAAGKFKSTAGSAACQQCPPDAYAGTGASACASCPANSYSLAGSTALANCTCAAGFRALPEPFACAACAPGSAKAAGNAPCVTCPAGTFAELSAMPACMTCPAYTYSTSGSAACTNCAFNEFSAEGSDSAADCECKAGYFRPENSSTECTACPVGGYRNTSHPQSWNNMMCMSCESGYSTPFDRSTSEQDCYLCPAGSYVAGVSLQDENGLYKLYSLPCVPCGANAQSSAGTDDGCVCDPGFEPNYPTCTACAYGFYKPLAGNHSCTACPAGKQGHAFIRFEEATACVTCPPNTHWTAVGESCSACDANSQAPAGSVAVANCTCNAGYENKIHGYSADYASAHCIPCLPGFFKATVSNALPCAACSGVLFSHLAAATACERCPANATGNLFNDADIDCTCDPGFTGNDGGPCVQCELGKYKTQRGADICGDCGPAAFWPVGASANPALFACEACPTYSTRYDDLTSAVLGCVCDAGFLRTDDTTCAICTAGYYCPEQRVQTPCPAHSFSAAGSATLQACQCVAGFHGGAGNCSACPANTFCAANSAVPAQCPANSTTLGQATRTNVTACVCLAGFYRINATGVVECRVCERGSFCFNERLMACPANSSAPPAADSVDDCTCDDGFRMLMLGTPSEQAPSAAVCEACDATIICRGGTVQRCALGAFNANFRCVCTAGSYCPGGPSSCIENACPACPHDHWCANNSLTSCEANEGAPANSTRREHCRCLDGFYRDHLGACLECPLHHVCRNETRRPVAEFDANLRTLSTRTVFISQAVCDVGFFRTAKTDLCKLCPLNFYCPSEAALQLPNVVRCPENEYTELPGATSRAECICMAGFKLSTEEQTAKCLPCQPGERCQGGAVLEVECHLQNKAITADHEQCVCKKGFGFLDFLCQRCPAGFVKPVIGDTPCVACDIGKYAANDTTCLPCAPHANARPGSAACTCLPPYVLQEHACVLCAANHFWTGTPGNPGACVACPANATNQPSSSMALDSTACRCAPGHYAAPWNVSGVLRCEACAAGSYEAAGACVACPTGAWAPARSASVFDCVCNAVSNATCHAMRVDRTCAGVCGSTPPACEPCNPGHYKPTPSTPGNTERCQACAEGSFQPAAAALSCEACPLNEWHTQMAATARSQCLCDPGWTRPFNGTKAPCAACNAGYYKDWIGDEVCFECAVGRYNPHLNATYCHFCSDASLELLLAAGATRPVLQSNTTVSEASVSILQCVCDRGHQPSNDSGALLCTPCAQGTFKEYKDHELCAYCGAYNIDHGSSLLHHFGAQASGAVAHSHCLECPAFSGQNPLSVGPGLVVMDTFDDCKCFPGHQNRSATGCGLCPPYMVQTAYSDDACVFCAAGHYFVERHTPCVACYLAGDGVAPHELLVLNRNDASLPWGADGGDCVCRLGHERDASDVCRACATGKFRGSNGTRLCTQCPVDTFQNATAALQCKLCPANSDTRGATGTATVQGCVCAAGFQPLQFQQNQHVCLPCVAGTYRERRFANESDQQCVQCPADHYCPEGSVVPQPCPAGELSLPGAPHIDNCLCPPGSGRLPGPAHAPQTLSNPCFLCAHAFYAPARSNDPCAACPALKNTSALGATTIVNCTCVPGHGVDSATHASDEAFLAAACAPCADGFFAPGGRSAPCVHCGWGAVTDPPSAATSPDHCQCNALVGLHARNFQ